MQYHILNAYLSSSTPLADEIASIVHGTGRRECSQLGLLTECHLQNPCRRTLANPTASGVQQHVYRLDAQS